MNISAAIADPLLRRAFGWRAPRASLATRLGDFATNCHEYCGLHNMVWFASGKATDETTWTVRIGRIILDEIPLEYSRFDLFDIQVIL